MAWPAMDETLSMTPIAVAPTMQPDSIDQLRSFCRGEMAAVATYEQALESLPLGEHADVLKRCKASHQQRVSLLAERITIVGGEAPETAGAWGSFVSFLEQAAAAVSAKMAIAVLEEGEDHGLRDYRRDLEKLDSSCQAFVEELILPLQIETHRLMSALQKSFGT